MKGLILLANYFEDIEALITIDMLRRANITIDLVSITGSYHLITQSNIKLEADYLIEQVNLDNYEFLVIPGGKAVLETHINSDITKNCINLFYNKEKMIACICAAPTILDLLGLLENKEYVCFPDCKKHIIGGKYKEDERVVVCNNIITSKAAGTTFDFAYAIIKYLRGEKIAKKTLESVCYK